MTKLYFTLLAAFIGLNANAQYTITASSAPVVGDLSKYYYADTTFVQGGSSGTSQVWNYTTLNVSPTPTLITETFMNVSSTPNGTTFPTANMAVQSSETPNEYAYYNYSSTKADVIGISNPTLNVVFSNPETIYTLPFFYGSSSVDNFAASFTVSGIPVSQTGTITTTGSGTGTLNLPNGMSYPNVLKVKVVQNTFTTLGSFGTESVADTSYIWVNAASKFALLSVEFKRTVTTTTSTTTKFEKKVKLNKIAYVGLKENESDITNFSVYPNPAKNEVSLNFSINSNDACKAVLYNTMGAIIKEVQFEKLSPGFQNMKIDLYGISPGIYFVKLKANNSETIKKIIVE